MKNIKLAASIALGLSLLFASCSVEKRHYTKGYNVDWNAKKEKTTETANKTSVAKENTEYKQVATQEPENNSTTEQASTTKQPEIITTEKPYNYDVKEPKAPKTKVVKKAFAQYNKMMEQTKMGKTVKKQFDKYSKKNIKDAGNTLAIIAFVCGAVALFAYYGAFFLALAAIIIGFITIKRTEGMYHAFSLWAIILGFVAIFLWLLILIIVIGIFAVAAAA